jgi:putative membrane protein
MPNLLDYRLAVPAFRTAGLVVVMAASNLLAVGYAQDSAKAATKTQLGPIDTYFVTQTSLGTPFQVDSGRLAQKKGGTRAIRSYAELMVGSHIEVNNALEAVLNRKNPVPPSTLLEAAYSTMISTLERENGQTFDADYVRGQVNYQKANAKLYQYELDNGTDPDLKAFARQTLPKIQDHLERALKLEREVRETVSGAEPTLFRCLERFEEA